VIEGMVITALLCTGMAYVGERVKCMILSWPWAKWAAAITAIATSINNARLWFNNRMWANWRSQHRG
jgi:hypothetical protein